ncbi:MAG: serine hydrolase [Propionibacteriales bacterium]|nr:serine hydrolase [Propionibacteriales bacterium]
MHAFAGTLTDEPAHDSGAMAPAGQLWSSLGDLGRFAAFLADPDPGVLSPDTMREMATLQSGTPEDGITVGYGLGLRLLNADGRTLVGHTGSMPGFLAGLYVDRERRTAAICLGNGTAGLRCEGLPMDLLATVERYEPALPPAWVPIDALPESVADVLGMWFWGETALVLSYADGELTLARPADPRPAYRFRPAGTDTFVGVAGYHNGETLRVLRDAAGDVHYLECATFVYTRRPYDASAPIPGGGAPGSLSSPG